MEKHEKIKILKKDFVRELTTSVNKTLTSQGYDSVTQDYISTILMLIDNTIKRLMNMAAPDTDVEIRPIPHISLTKTYVAPHPKRLVSGDVINVDGKYAVKARVVGEAYV